MGEWRDRGAGGDRAFDVVMVTRGHAATLPAALEAVAALEPRPETVAVLDNASDDGSAEVAAAFGDRLPLVLLQSDANVGFAAGINRCLERGSAPWVLFLNPDCAPRPDFAARLAAAAASRPEADRIGSVTGRLLRAAGPDLAPAGTLDAAGMVVTPAGRHLDRGAGEPDDGRYGEPAWVFGGTGAATLFRRTALLDVAYPDGQVLAESFFAYREDAELAWRLQWRGWRCLYVPGAVAVHLRGLRPERGRRQSPEIDRLSVRNRFLLRVHCADAAWHLRCFPWWLLRDLAVAGACLTVERGSLPGLVEAWRGRREAVLRRRWVLGRRRVSSRHVARWFRRGGRVEPLEVT